MKKTLIKKYAKLIAVQGIGLRKGQQVVVRAPVFASDFVELLVEQLYKSGASRVSVDWNDGNLLKTKLKYESKKSLQELPNWVVEKAKYGCENKVASISISSNDPDGLKGIDFRKMQVMRMSMLPLKKYNEPYMASQIQWCVAAIPNPKWAKKVFPDLKTNQAVEALWKAILDANRVYEDNDPIEAWKEHSNKIHARAKILNDYQFKTLKYKSSNGTDLEIGLVDNHIWAGGSEGNVGDLPEFNPNMPTEEIFTMPHKYKVNGIVYSTKPLSYQGVLIEDFYLVFKDGKVIEAKAKKGQEALDAMLNTDATSRYIGEVALVEYHSPISQSNIIFYNTLFDENASCHLALGAAYTMNVEGGTTASKEKLEEIGCNDSMIHVDFMVGSKDLSIIGITKDGKEVTIFKDGDFAL